MADASADALRAALRAIKDPASGRDIVTAGLVEAIETRGGLVHATLLTDRAHAAAMEPVRRQVEALLVRQPGVTALLAPLALAPGPGRRRRIAGTEADTPQPTARRANPRCCCRISRRSSRSHRARAGSANRPSR
jgi:metal-sulfur cluster biosynthetic enzyme